MSENIDPDCQRCRGGGCEWCHNTGRAHVQMPLSDVNDLDAVVHALGIEDSDAAPAEAVAELHTEITTLRTLAAELAEALNTVVNAYEGQTFGTPYEMTRALPDAHTALGKARAAGLVP